MTVVLSQAEADQKIAQIEEARNQAVAKLQQIQSTQDAMLAQAWQGHSATNYSRTSAQQHDDFTKIINDLNVIVDKGSTHIRSIAAMDNG